MGLIVTSPPCNVGKRCAGDSDTRANGSAESYLITLNAGESRAVHSKIESGDVAGLTRCVLVNSPDYYAPLAELKTRTFSLSEAIEPPANGIAVVGG